MYHILKEIWTELFLSSRGQYVIIDKGVTLTLSSLQLVLAGWSERYILTLILEIH